MVKEFATFASLQATADAATSLAIGRPASNQNASL